MAIYVIICILFFVAIAVLMRDRESYLSGPLNVNWDAIRFVGETDPMPQWNGKGWAPDIGVYESPNYDPEMIMSLKRMKLGRDILPIHGKNHYLGREFHLPGECDTLGTRGGNCHYPKSKVARDNMKYVNQIGTIYL